MSAKGLARGTTISGFLKAVLRFSVGSCQLGGFQGYQILSPVASPPLSVVGVFFSSL